MRVASFVVLFSCFFCACETIECPIDVCEGTLADPALAGNRCAQAFGAEKSRAATCDEGGGCANLNAFTTATVQCGESSETDVWCCPR